MQVLCLGGEYRDALVTVAVRGGPGYAESDGQQGEVLALAEPHQDQQRLVEARGAAEVDSERIEKGRVISQAQARIGWSMRKAERQPPVPVSQIRTVPFVLQRLNRWGLWSVRVWLITCGVSA